MKNGLCTNIIGMRNQITFLVNCSSAPSGCKVPRQIGVEIIFAAKKASLLLLHEPFIALSRCFGIFRHSLLPEEIVLEELDVVFFRRSKVGRFGGKDGLVQLSELMVLVLFPTLGDDSVRICNRQGGEWMSAQVDLALIEEEVCPVNFGLLWRFVIFSLDDLVLMRER